MLKSVYHKADETTVQKAFASIQQSLITMNTYPNPSLNTGVDHSGNQEGAETRPRPEEINLEDISVHFLQAYSIHPNWRQIISSRNDYGQTMAHISVTLGYLRLLRHLFTWGINLNAVDNTGLTALHYAYLFKQGECARFLIHSGVDQFILDDLGRSFSDLDPFLSVKLYSNTDIDSDSHAEDASPIEYDTEMPDEAEKLHAKHFLVQRWMLQSEDERRGDAPPSRCQSPEPLGPSRLADSPPALDSADDKDRGVTCDRSPSLGVHIPEENSIVTSTEEVKSEPSIEIAVSPHNAPPPSHLSEFSAQVQEAIRPSDLDLHPSSHPAPLGGTNSTPDLEHPQSYHEPRTCHHSDKEQRNQHVTPATPSEASVVTPSSAVAPGLSPPPELKHVSEDDLPASLDQLCAVLRQHYPDSKSPGKLFKAFLYREKDLTHCKLCKKAPENRERMNQHVMGVHCGHFPFGCDEPGWWVLLI